MTIAGGARGHRWVSCCLAAVLAAGCGAGYGGARKVAAPGGAYGGGHALATEAHAPAPIADHAPQRPGLGTAWGEAVSAPVTFSPFHRASAAPWAEVALHYNDAHGVGAHAAYLGTLPSPLEVTAGDGGITVALVDEAGRILPGYHARGRALVVGEDGARYKIVVRNGTSARFEVVASVDGLDVIDGSPADPQRRGYIVDPYGVLVIDGFRTSDHAVAAFRFGRVDESYAANTVGDRHVGVIGLAVFAERGAVWTRGEIGLRDSANPFPRRGSAMPPR